MQLYSRRTIECNASTCLAHVQGFREPLYLTDKPMVYTDCRTEEEKRYPEFFRHQTQNGRKQDVP